MSNRGLHGLLAVAGFAAAISLACHASSHLAGTLLNGLSLPVMTRLHAFTARAAFPIVELMALALAAILSFTLIASLVHGASTHSLRPLGRWLLGLGWMAAMLGGMLIALWSPVREVTSDTFEPVPTPERLDWLCGELIDALNASGLAWPSPEASLDRAPEVAGQPECVVKAARYPEWMRLARISGLFVPLTGEALVDAGTPAPLVPFTAVHELMHLAGVADEGEANIAAWESCQAAGGAFADSARLWALRYAMGMLCQEDPDAWRQAHEKMEGTLARTFQVCGGEATGAAQAALGAGMLPLSRGDYAALVSYLVVTH